MSLIIEANHYWCVCACLCVCACVFVVVGVLFGCDYVHGPLRLQVIHLRVMASHWRSGKHPASDMPLFFPSLGTDTPVGLFFQRHPSPFSNIKVAFERAIRTKGEPFMWFVEHGRGPCGRLKEMNTPGRCMSWVPTRKYTHNNVHAIFLFTLQRDCNISGKIT